MTYNVWDGADTELSLIRIPVPECLIDAVWPTVLTDQAAETSNYASNYKI